MTVTDSVRSALSDRYSIEREIGAGGMATVYLARDIKHDREVAIKVLRADLSAMIGSERFLAEVRIAARLDHPHILTLIDSGSAGGILYYVLPYVRGESLRAKLDREKQLSLEESLSITKQVASALEYAHDQGIVHRDIKPENILLHEGEAVLADFGIALAVKEAGGNRLTETGLSLGTPQYMSPEQATGDRTLDRRSDIYSLGAVLYEMLSGEPPVTGATAQVVIAKLLTEKPVRLRVVRDSVPDAVERAVEKSLSKVPADRFKSAADFVRALEVAAPVENRTSRSSSARVAIPLAAGVVLLLAAGAWFARGRIGAKSGPAVTLGDRTQLTNTGKASSPMISADGKSIAYVVSECGAAGCSYGIEWKDIGEQSSHRVFSGAKSVYNPLISPDRRSILFQGTVGDRYGSWLISTLGGEPRWIAPQQAIFWADGDSLISIPNLLSAKVFWLRVSGLDGIVRDSIRVDGPGDNIAFITAIPRSGWLLVPLRRMAHVEWLVIDRTGKVASRSTRPFYRGIAPIASYDAVWMAVARSGSVGRSVVRFAFDPVAGKLADQGDTVYAGLPTGFSVNADGSAMVVDEGTTEFSTWALSMAELKSGVFPERAKVASATSALKLRLSPDGSTLMLFRYPSRGTAAGIQISLRAFGGGPETPLPGNYTNAGFVDSTIIEATERVPGGVRLSRVSYTGHKYASYIVADTNLIDFTNVGDRGWAWIPFDQKTIEISDSGDSRVRHIPIPAWYRYINQINSPPDGKEISLAGWKAPVDDSAIISTMNVADGKIIRQAARLTEGIYATWLNDRSLLLTSNETAESISLFRLVLGGKLELVANIPRALAGVSVSGDLKRATAGVRNYHGDVWMMKVNKR